MQAGRCGFLAAPGTLANFFLGAQLPIFASSCGPRRRGGCIRRSCVREDRKIETGLCCRQRKRQLHHSSRSQLNTGTSWVSEKNDACLDVFSGLGDSDIPVGICETVTLACSLSLDDAIVRLVAALERLEGDPPPFGSGIFRFQVPLPPDLKALHWLQCQPLSRQLLPRCYFSPRSPRGDGSGEPEFNLLDVDIIKGTAGVGSAVLFTGEEPFSLKHWKAVRRYLSPSSPLIRAYGGMRFDPDAERSEEWRDFGSFYFLIPQVEFCECDSCSLLAVTVAWDTKMGWAFKAALNNAYSALHEVSFKPVAETGRLSTLVKCKEHMPNERAWHAAVDKSLSILAAGEPDGGRSRAFPKQTFLDPSFLDEINLSKIVMARRTKLDMEDTVDPLTLLATLQAKDSSAYQFCIQIPDGSAFVGSTPERLFVRNGLLVSSEAVAGTRSRGTTESEDLEAAFNLLLSEKDHNEFEIVRESIKRHLEMVCKRVDVETHKDTIKQARVQHLYSRFNGVLNNESGEYRLLSLLHPTPAVCGHPQQPAKAAIASSEQFDRGMYAGPVGWIGGDGAEFCVGIRSSLVKPGQIGDGDENAGSQSLLKGIDNGSAVSMNSTNGSSSISEKGSCIYLYAGVGVVKGAKSESEWQELELKISQFEALLKPTLPLQEAPNINYVWARLIVEELCRLGITLFCIAPGSRSSPLTAAAAANSRVTCITCIDERSLAFYALGYGKGANKPAVIITSSGTAVSNLLPAVVEACQDFVPMLLLTADRPSEMQDAGANQTIDQDKHFGGFVRYHINLPPPIDKVLARVVLTTIDSAVFRATTEPVGPVHINCQFREPLAGTAEPWDTQCLKGLKRWVFSTSPFTKYASNKAGLLSGGHPSPNSELEGVAKILRSAKRGLIVVGGLQMESETWAVALLAHHLGWPVVPDVVSGLRLGKAHGVGDEAGKKLQVIHNFDHVLLSTTVYSSVTPDVVLQIGGRLTSKRLGQFLELCQPRAYILVEEHNFRQDPSHMLTHRIQCSAVEFSSMMKGALSPGKVSEYAKWLQELSELCGQEITSRLRAESSLTEPQIAQFVAASVPVGAALFLGNSLAIRDVDMYGQGLFKHPGNFNSEAKMQFPPDFGTRVAANRGASGIDGVLSTAIGFASGSNRRVTLLLGDVSFLHDTNGLTFLTERFGQPPVTVVVVNNAGGGIFSLLPIAKTVPPHSFQRFWGTPHDVGLDKLCLAHRVGHMLVRTKRELETTMRFAQQSRLSWVVEVKSSIEENSQFHRFLASAILQKVKRSYGILSSVKIAGGRISDFEIYRHSFPLQAPPTTNVEKDQRVREGFLIRLTLSNGASAIGEVAPLPGLHEENLVDVEEQLRLMAFAMKDVCLVRTLPLLNGSISDWLLNNAGVEPKSLFPSVRCGLEMAILGVIAHSSGCSLCDLLLGGRTSMTSGNEEHSSPRAVRICALIDSEGTLDDVVDTAERYAKQGYCTLKVKVARREDPMDDAAVIKAVRKRVGPSVRIRADANRKWTYDQAVVFANEVRRCDLQYLEEPLRNAEDIPMFCKETGLAVALDETIDELVADYVEKLSKYAVNGVVALVIKPSRVGGFERAAAISQWGLRHGMAVVVSAAFESSISLAAYAEFAGYMDELCLEVDEGKYLQPVAVPLPSAHGLGTFAWLPEVHSGGTLNAHFKVEFTSMGVVAPLTPCDGGLELKADPVGSKVSATCFSNYVTSVKCDSATYNFSILDTAADRSKQEGVEKRPTLLFLHGFLGTAKDWVPIMDSLSISFRCIAVDLIGHGETTVDEIQPDESSWNFNSLSAALSDLILSLAVQNVVLVGYSMGGRIALYHSLRSTPQVVAAVMVSASPGLSEGHRGGVRAAQDDELARVLKEAGLKDFVDLWYNKPLWNSIRGRPDFEEMKKKRMNHKDVHALARSLTCLSIGRQPSVWESLRASTVPLLCIVGKLDSKFVKIAHQMQEVCEARNDSQTLAFPSLSADDDALAASLAREQQMQDLPESFTRGGGADLWNMLPEELENYLPTERENFLTTVQKTLSSWNLEEDDGFAEFVAQEVKKWEQDEDFQWSQDESDSSNPEQALEKVAETTQMTVLEVENCGHAVVMENPLALARALRTFAHSL